MFLTFPDFNLFSTPLLVLVSQGVVFGFLLLLRFYSKHGISDLFLALLVLITCFHRTTFTIGFMDWYDTYQNTKINYWLINLNLAIGPLIFFYVKSVTTSDFKFRKKYLKHFFPAAIYILYCISIFTYDANQPGFDDSQNGILMLKLVMGSTGIFIEAFSIIHQLLYLAFTLQLYFVYKKSIKNYFSNTYRLELNWIRNFLYIYTLLFLYSSTQHLINISVAELSWIQKWWYQFFSALAVIYIGIKGYFTDTSTLNGLDFKLNKKSNTIRSLDKDSTFALTNENRDVELNIAVLLDYMEKEKPYLRPDLNLKELAREVNMSRTQLSETINIGFRKNFNDFINSYRIDTFKKMLSEGKQDRFSLLGIAYECGFNSKATFNRVFKKMTDSSPTEYLQNQL